MITFESSGGSITLPNPILGDNDQVNLFTTIQISMVKEFHTTKRTPVRHKFLLNFVEVRQSVYNLFRTWLLASSGYEITYTDYNGDVWVGFIVNRPIEITTIGRKTCDPYKEVVNFTIDFEGLSLA